VENRESLVNLAVLDASINETSVRDTVRYKTQVLHLVKTLEGIVELVVLPISLDEDAVGNSTGSYPLDAHLVEDGYRSVHVPEADTSVYQTIVEDLVGAHSTLLLHLVQKHESFV
jgi:hypothetical protein